MKKNISIGKIFAIFVILLLAGMIIYVVNLKIEKISYAGCINTSGKTIEKYLFTDKIDYNPLVFFFKSKFQEHKTIPFVEQYEVEMVNLKQVKITVYEKTIIGYLAYMGEYMYFDKDGIVVEVTAEKLEYIVPVTGIEFDHIVMDEEIPVKNRKTFDTILDITQLIYNYKVPVDSVAIDRLLNITLYIGQVKVEIGQDDDTLSEKINDLSEISKVMEDVPGVLDMTEYQGNDKGYTFKKN